MCERQWWGLTQAVGHGRIRARRGRSARELAVEPERTGPGSIETQDSGSTGTSEARAAPAEEEREYQPCHSMGMVIISAGWLFLPPPAHPRPFHILVTIQVFVYKPLLSPRQRRNVNECLCICSSLITNHALVVFISKRFFE